MNSLPSINPTTVAQIKVALDAWGKDAEFLVKFVEAVMKINGGTGYGKVIVYITKSKIVMLRSEETHSFTDAEDFKFDNS